MTSAIIGNISPAFLPRRLIDSRSRLLFGPKYYTPVLFKRCGFAANVRAASSTAFVKTKPTFELMKKYLNPVLGGNIVDASCGCGLFSRLFTRSGLFSLVVALDYSESMLQQCYRFIK